MCKSLSLILAFLLIPLIGICQSKPERIHTQSTFATFGDFNSQNGYMLFSATDVDTISKKLIGTSVRLKNMSTEEEIIIQRNTLLPAIGWLDSSHVLIEAVTSIGEQKVFGDWKGYLIKHNIFTHQQDTLPSSWYTSYNSVENFLTSSNKLFYSIAYGSEEMKTTHWVEYLIGTGESKIIKKYDNHSFSILTYQYTPDNDEIIYIKGKGGKKELVSLSVSTGTERLIKTLPYQNFGESSAVINGKFYFVVRDFPKDNSNHTNWKKVSYFLKSLDLKTGLISNIYISKSEITKVSSFQKGMILLSIQGSSSDSNVKKSFDLKAGGEVAVGLDATSYLYTLKLKN